MKNTIILLLVLVTSQAAAQEISGRVLNYTKEPIPDAVVGIYREQRLKKTTRSDFDGEYVIATIDTGRYNVLFTYPGYDSILVKDVEATDCTIQNCVMQKPKSNAVPVLVIRPYRKIVSDTGPPAHILTKDEADNYKGTRIY